VEITIKRKIHHHSGIAPDTVVSKAADINEDEKIGLEEAIYALRNLLQR